MRWFLLALTLLWIVFSLVASHAEDFPHQRGGWKISRDYGSLHSALLKEANPGDTLLFFSARSYFEDTLRGGSKNLKIAWVVPGREEITEQEFERFRKYLEEKFGDVGPDVGNGTLPDGQRRFSASISGCSVEIFSYRRHSVLPAGGGKTIVFAESSFPARYYENEATNPMIKLLLGYAFLLDKYRASGSSVYILDDDRSLPLSYRYFARYLAEIFRNPEMIGKEIPRKWRLRANGEYLEFFLQDEDALKQYKEAQRMMPKDPAIHYQVAYLQALGGDMEFRKNLDKAFRLDDSFFEGYLEIAAALNRGHRNREAINLLKHALEIHPSDSRARKMLSDVERERSELR